MIAPIKSQAKKDKNPNKNPQPKALREDFPSMTNINGTNATQAICHHWIWGKEMTSKSADKTAPIKFLKNDMGLG